ncbi:hypothetical protein BH11MYX1_BH11MYX1_09890 [soil metagenome]
MEHRSITCPLSAHLEQLELERTALGTVVASCSRFGSEPVTCSHECARRMDIRDHAVLDQVKERVLVLHAATSQARACAERLACHLRSDSLVPELGNSEVRGAPPPEDYEAVVFVSPLRRGRHTQAIDRYLADHRLALATMPTFFVEPDRETAARISELAKAIGDEIPVLSV